MTGIGDTYECAVCRGVFRKTVSDEEALAEMRETWLPLPDDDKPGALGIVCDDCYAQVSAWAQLDHPEFLRGQP